MNKKELKPCPFCSGEAKYDNSDGYDYIFCDECGARAFGFNKEHAFDEWNKRAKYVNNVNNESNSSEFPNSSKVNQSVQVPEVVENGNCKYLPEECCNKSCKNESATLKTLVHKWTKHSIEDYLYLSVELYKYCVLWFEYWSESGQLAVCIVNNSSEELLYEDIGVFNTIKEANSKVIEFIKKLGERLVCFAENIKIEE